MASLLLTTAILNLKSLAEEKLFLYLSRGATAHCRLSLQTLVFIAHLAIVVCSASGATPPRDVLNLRHSSAMSSRFFYQWQTLSCSVWEAASANVCALCAKTILGLVQVCELQSSQVLDCDQCASILLLLFQFCSFSLTSSFFLSLSQASHTWWWVNKVSPSTLSLFLSLIMKELCPCCFSGLGFA